MEVIKIDRGVEYRAAMKEGKDGKIVATFGEDELHETEYSNLLLHLKKQATEASKKKKPAAAKAKAKAKAKGKAKGKSDSDDEEIDSDDEEADSDEEEEEDNSDDDVAPLKKPAAAPMKKAPGIVGEKPKQDF
jgi:hypothetical protein